MQINKLRNIFMLIFCYASLYTSAQVKQWEDIDTLGYYKKETNTRNGITLTFINKDSLLDLRTQDRLKDAFWKVYPAQMARFNKHSNKNITVMVGDEYKGVAATWKSVIKIDKDWLRNNPEDIDLITHELMHVVQGYTYQVPDNWLTDGIADYGRYAFGVNNAQSGWSLTEYAPGQSYKNSYRIAARFLLWVEKLTKKDVVVRLDAALRKGTYTPKIWISLSGKTLDELWQAYTIDPRI